MNATIYPCKMHNAEHLYTVCPICAHQYCAEYWTACPRADWANHSKERRTPSADAPIYVDPTRPVDMAALGDVAVISPAAITRKEG